MTSYSLNRCNNYIDRIAYNNYILSIVLQTRVIMIFSFISDEFELENSKISMIFSSLDETKYEIETKLLLAINNFIKHQNYAICIFDSQKNAKEMKNKLIINCNRERKQESSQFTRKKLEVDSVRVNCLFRAFAKLNDNELWVLNKIKTTKYNHVDDEKSSHVKIRQVFMTKKIKKNIKDQYYSNQKSTKIFDFVRKKYRLNSNNVILSSQDVYNYLSILKFDLFNFSHRNIASASTLHSHNFMFNW